jgi:hypothetical protein
MLYLFYLDCFTSLAMTTNVVRHCEQSEAIQKYYIRKYKYPHICLIVSFYLDF